MKKLSLVMAAAMCMTVGGVYATWSYATEEVKDNALAHTIGIEMTTPTQDGTSAVTISYVGTPDIKFQIDGADYSINPSKKNTAELKHSGNAITKVEFSESASAQSVTLTYVFLLSNAKYGPDDIFTVTPAASSTKTPTETGAISITWTQVVLRSAGDTQEITLTSQDIQTATGLALTKAFKLENRTEFNNFQNYLQQVSMSINVNATITATTGA